MLVNILGVLAALALAVSGYLAWENKGAYEAQIANGKLEERQLKQAQTDLTGTNNEITVAKDGLEDKTATVDELAGELADQEEVLADIDVEIEDQKLDIAEKKEELAELEEETREIGDADELIAEVKRFGIEINELETEISTAKSKRSALDSTSEKLVTDISTIRSKTELYNGTESDPALKTTIAQVFRGYGFVTIKGGDSVGIIKGSTLDVIRGGDTVAKLLVTTVEPGSAAADIIPESVGDGISVYAGDTVVSGTPLPRK